MLLTVKKFKILKMRSKISYHAFLKKSTILEHFLENIQKSHQIFHGVSEVITQNQGLVKEFKKSLTTSDFTGSFIIAMKLNFAQNPYLK